MEQAEEQAELQLESRAVTGKKVRQLRAVGVVPVHVYGPGITSVTAQVSTSDLSQVLSSAGKTSPIRLLFSGQIEGPNSFLVFVREIQRHPTTGALQHVDFLKVDTEQRMSGDVPVVLSGEAPAVRLLGGVLSQILYVASVECLPLDMPQSLSVDVSVLEGFEDSITVADLSLPPRVSMLSELDGLVARVNQPRRGTEVEADISEEIHEGQPVEQVQEEN
jgi:large subunit ribosomal protein L25